MMIQKLDLWITGGYVIQDGVKPKDDRPWHWHINMYGNITDPKNNQPFVKANGLVPDNLDQIGDVIDYAYQTFRENVIRDMDIEFENCKDAMK